MQFQVAVGVNLLRAAAQPKPGLIATTATSMLVPLAAARLGVKPCTANSIYLVVYTGS